VPAPWKVLLVDDQDIFVRSVETLLEDSPDVHIVGHAWNGEVALELVAQLAPDVVLMDIDMPVMDGVEATRLLSERFPDVRVLVLSGLHEPERIDAAVAAGAVGALAKTEIAEGLVPAIVAAARGDAVSREAS
jgi:NarL family two-component system response regulator LiaR